MLDWVLVLSLRIYSCVVVEGMYTCKTGHFGHKPCCLCLCCSRRYVHTKMLNFWHQLPVFMFMLLNLVFIPVGLSIFVNILYVLVCVVVEGLYTYKTIFGK